MCGKLKNNSGWRIYMEDASLSVSPLTDKKNSLFAVFDGHGGILISYTRTLSCRFCVKTFYKIILIKSKL
jgi:hypothetical protein